MNQLSHFLPGIMLAAVCTPALCAQAAPQQSNEKLPQPPVVTNSYPLANEADREKTVKLTQQLVVDLLATFNDYKEAHWNLNGPLYLVLHEYYQGQADYYRKEADVFAERTLHMGYSVDGRYSTIARTSTLPEMPAGYITDDDSLKLMIERVTVLDKEIYSDIAALNNSDPVTSNQLQDLAYVTDKNLWQLRIHLAKPGGLGADLPWAAQQSRHETNGNAPATSKSDAGH